MIEEEMAVVEGRRMDLELGRLDSQTLVVTGWTDLCQALSHCLPYFCVSEGRQEMLTWQTLAK